MRESPTMQQASLFSQPAFDEMFVSEGQVRPHYQEIFDALSQLTVEERIQFVRTTEQRMMEEGITFTLRNSLDSDALERTIPFDLVPRVIPQDEWTHVERGLKQRVQALNHFLWDIYHDQQILHDNIVPRKMVVGHRHFRPEMMNLDVPGEIYTATSGIDLVRDPAGRYLVLSKICHRRSLTWGLP